MLSSIDPESRTAICSVCGPTKIWIFNDQGIKRFSCATYNGAIGTKYRRTHYSKTPKPGAHSLSQIDENKKTAVCSRCGQVNIYIWQGKKKIGTRCCNAYIKKGSPAQNVRREENLNLINKHKIEHGCNRCGYNANLLKLSLFTGVRKKKQPNTEKLLKLRRDKLESYYVLCESCTGLANN